MTPNVTRFEDETMPRVGTMQEASIEHAMAAVVAPILGSPGTYGISFPDFDGCISGGGTVDECLARGREALAFHLESVAETGEAMPRLRTLDEIKRDPSFREDFSEDALAALVEIELPGRSVHVDIAIDQHLLEMLDRRAAEIGESRDALISKGARAVLVG